MTLVPHGSRVLIRPDADDGKSKIFIPEKFQKAADRGTVISVGAGRRRIDGTMCPLQAQPGDRVIFSLVQIMRLEHEGEKLAVMDEDAILVFLRPDELKLDGTAFGAATGIAANLELEANKVMARKILTANPSA